jgi:CheY-like chemotaxis protein
MFNNGALHQRGQVVLLVDDEESIRRLVRLILESRGYVVLDASDGLEGLAVCRTWPGPIDILLSDIVMPRLDGRALAAAAMELRPELKVLLMSGCSDDPVLDHRAGAGMTFLQKPFTSATLERKVRTALDSRAAAA